MRHAVLVLVIGALAACGSSGKSPSLKEPASCASPVRSSVLPADWVQDLGTLQVGSDATFVVGAGTSSFVIFSQEAAGSAAATVLGIQGGQRYAVPNAVVPTNVRSPAGTTYYDDLDPWPAVTIGSAAYADVSGLIGYDPGFQPVAAAFPVPNTSAGLARVAGGVEVGTWHFTVNDWARQCPFSGCIDGDTSGRYRVQVVTRPGTSPDPTLDLEIYLATDPTSVLSTAAAAQADPQVARWIHGVASYLGNASIQVGQVTFHDLASAVKNRYAPNGSVDVTDGSPCGDLAQLFTNAVAPRRAVHLFLADELTARTGQTEFIIVGVDGSIPGPSGFPGTISGGAIVGLFGELGYESSAGACAGAGALDLAGCGTDRLAYVAAHEIGHWLGLFHTTEQEGTFFDPVADTDRCPCLSCAAAAQQSGCAEKAGASATTVVTNDRCTASSSCGGGRNLMFWLLDPARSTGELSPDQGQIARLNPAVQ